MTVKDLLTEGAMLISMKVTIGGATLLRPLKISAQRFGELIPSPRRSVVEKMDNVLSTTLEIRVC